MGDLMIIIGGIVALIGAFDLIDAEKMKEIKPILTKVFGGGIVAGVGYLLRNCGI